MDHNTQKQQNAKSIGRTHCIEERSENGSDSLSSLESWEDSSGITGKNQNAFVFKDGFASVVQQLSESQTHILSLEKEVTSLKEEKLKQEYQNQLCVTRLKEQIKKLEHKAAVDLEELKRRQSQIELEVPSLEDQIKSLKNVLHDLNISDSLYSELITIPKEDRTVREHLQVLAYEKLQSYRNDVEALRRERDTSREALSRANDEVQKVTRELQRITTVGALEQQCKDKETEAIVAQNKILEAELQNMSLQLQVLSAKGALYDEVKSKVSDLEKLLTEKEKEKTELSKSTEVLVNEKKLCEESLREKEHCIELLNVEKAYLNGLLKAQEDQLWKAEAEKNSQQEKINEIANFNTEQHLHDEKLKLQEKNKQDLEMFKAQLTAASEFEIEIHRKGRDAAVAECEKLQTALQQANEENKLLIQKYHDLQFVNMKSSNVMDSTIFGGAGQTYHMLCETKIENEVLKKKLESLTENILAIESGIAKDVIELKVKLETANACLRQHQVEEKLVDEVVRSAIKFLADTDGSKLRERHVEISSVIPGRLNVLFMVINRCKSLQEKICSLENEKSALKNKVIECELKVRDLGQMSKQMACMDVSISTDKRLKESLHRQEVLELQLREAVIGKEKASNSLQKLRDDLKRLLQSRGSVEGLQQILMEKDCNLGNAVFEKLGLLRRFEQAN